MAPAASIEAVEAAVLAVVTLTRGDAVKLEDAEVVCLWKRKLEILGIVLYKIKNASNR